MLNIKDYKVIKTSCLAITLLTVLGLTSCSSDDDSTPEPITKANIIGSVSLYDEGITQVDNADMTIKVEGTSPTISTTTDANGNFTLTDVPFGTYTIIYEKVGYGTYKRFDIEHSNTGTSTRIIGTPSLGQVSTTQVDNLSANVNGNDVVLSVSTSPAGNAGNTRYVRYFLSTSSDVSDVNYTYFSPGLTSKINPKEITLTASDLSNAGFTSGETVYVKVYGDSFWSSEYDDSDLSRKIFPNLNTTSANAVSFVIP